MHTKSAGLQDITGYTPRKEMSIPQHLRKMPPETCGAPSNQAWLVVGPSLRKNTCQLGYIYIYIYKIGTYKRRLAGRLNTRTDLKVVEALNLFLSFLSFFISRSISLGPCLSICLSNYLLIYPIYPYLRLTIHPYTHPSKDIYLSYSSIHPSVYLYISRS